MKNNIKENFYGDSRLIWRTAFTLSPESTPGLRKKYCTNFCIRNMNWKLMTFYLLLKIGQSPTSLPRRSVPRKNDHPPHDCLLFPNLLILLKQNLYIKKRKNSNVFWFHQKLPLFWGKNHHRPPIIVSWYIKMW